MPLNCSNINCGFCTGSECNSEGLALLLNQKEYSSGKALREMGCIISGESLTMARLSNRFNTTSTNIFTALIKIVTSGVVRENLRK